MVRKRERKTTRGTTPRDTILKAVKAVKLNNFSIRRAASVFNINYRTLSRYCKKIPERDLSENNTTPTISVGYAKSRQIFSNSQEIALIFLSEYFGLPPKEIRILAYKVAHHSSIHVPESWIKNEMAGEDWFTGLMKRHSDLPIQKSKAISKANVTDFRGTNRELFFNNFIKLMSHLQMETKDVLKVVTTTVPVPDRTVVQKHMDLATSNSEPLLEENKNKYEQQTTTEKNIEATTSLECHVSHSSEKSDENFKILNSLSENLHLLFLLLDQRKFQENRIRDK